jgi:hypothetical protein
VTNPRAGTPAPIEIIAIAAQPSGWFVDYQDGNALEVACWGLLSDNSGAVPMVFSQNNQKLVDAASIGTYTMFHKGIIDSDNIVTLIDHATDPTSSPVVSLGGMYSRKSSYVSADAGASFSATLRGSLDNEFWFDIAVLNQPGVESEVLKTVHYAQAILDSVSGGAVTIRLSWS